MGKRKAYLVLAAALVLMVVCAACSAPSAEQEPEPTSSELAAALSNGRPTLAGFVTQTCACKDIRPALQELTAEYQGRLNVTVIEYTDQKDVFAQHQVVLAPTLVFFDSGGEEVDREDRRLLDREEIVDRLNALGLV